jgi:hypothetical protein
VDHKLPPSAEKTIFAAEVAEELRLLGVVFDLAEAVGILQVAVILSFMRSHVILGSVNVTRITLLYSLETLAGVLQLTDSTKEAEGASYSF